MTEKIHTALILVEFCRNPTAYHVHNTPQNVKVNTTPTTNSNKKALVLFLQAMAGNGTPENIAIGVNSKVWLESEVQEWIDAKIQQHRNQ